jgi:Clp amino terminal domain, pathogenicity island component/Phage derived protein Gp49-like (DUF891)
MLSPNYIGTEHILLGLIREGDGVAAQVLVRLGANLNRVRQQVIQLLHGYQGKELASAEDRQGRGPGDHQGQAAPALGRPLVDSIAHSEIRNLKGLRPGSAGHSEVRILFAFDPWRSAILLTESDKSGDDAARRNSGERQQVTGRAGTAGRFRVPRSCTRNTSRNVKQRRSGDKLPQVAGCPGRRRGRVWR